MSIVYSVVIPLKDEEDNVALLVDELAPVMEGLSSPWELLCIDDGSSDGTLEELERLKRIHPQLTVLSFDRNYGQSSAFDAGFRRAKGDFIITMDGDLQNDPKDIPKLLKEMGDHDLVCGYREKRRDSFLKRTISYLANKVRSTLLADQMRDTGCSLKVYRRSCFEKIKLYNGMHRFLPALFKIEQFRVAEIAVNHRAREHGKTKYSFTNRSFNTIADLFAVRWMRRRALRYRIKEKG